VTWHNIREYLKYIRKAKDLHGVHSPFVYAFNEQVLHKASKNNKADNLILMTSSHKKLVNRIIGYFQCRNIFWITNKQGEKETYLQITPREDGQIQLKSERIRFEEYKKYPAPDLLLLDLSDPTNWRPAFQRYASRLSKDSLVIITSIHQSLEHTRAWEQLIDSPGVSLSIDLFKTGLLFFKEDMRDKQHFILKY
jgi:hypothetical protein